MSISSTDPIAITTPCAQTVQHRKFLSKPVLLIDHRAGETGEAPAPHASHGIEVVAIRDPYTALSILDGDPSGYSMLVVSETAFASDED